MTKGLLVMVAAGTTVATATMDAGVQATTGVLTSLLRVERVAGAFLEPAAGSSSAPAVSAPPGRFEAVAVAWQDEQDTEELVADLSAADATTRALAACRLARLRSRRVAEEAMERLLEMLPDATPVEPQLCREWERPWGFDGRLESSSPGREAALALERTGREAVEPLSDVLRDHESPVARRHAALALGLIEDRRAIDVLAEALADDVVEVRARSAWALGMIESANGVEALVGALDDADAGVRAQAAWALGMIESSAAVEGLLAALDDPDPEVREQVAWALGMIEARSGVGGLGAALSREDDPEVREQMAWALGMIEDPAGVNGLALALDDEDAGVREQAAWALGMIEDPAAVDGLVQALDDGDPAVREQVAWALGMIEDPSAVEGLIEALDDEDTEVRRQVMWALMRVVEHLDDADIDYERIAEALRRAREGGGFR